MHLLCGDGVSMTAPDVLSQLVRAVETSEGHASEWSATAMEAWSELRRIVGAMNSRQLEEFVIFTTGCRLLPKHTFITVQQDHVSPLPRSSTCSNELFLPCNSMDVEGSLSSAIELAVRSSLSSGFLMQ